MKNLILAMIAIAMLAAAAPAQSKDEQEILRIHHGLEQAYIKGEIAPFESATADYYTFAGPGGNVQTRAEMLKEMRDEIAKPTVKNISEVSDNVKVHVLGATALVTANWTSVSQGLTAGDEPHTDKGQYTGIYEKSDGKWWLIREAFTESQHDRKVMEASVLAASNAFDAIMKSRDKAAYERMLHADYTYTTEDGKLVSRAEDIAHFSSPDIAITLVEASDKKVRIIGNTSAVETGKYHVTGTSKGKPFDETGRYTTTWIWKELRWQIIADHNSIVTK